MAMKRYTPDEIQTVLAEHKKWLADEGGARANLSEANLSEANLSGANLSGADLSGANLSGANLSGANLYRADLSESGLYRADLSRANLSGANLSGADLSRANLSGANLYGANLYGVKVKKAAAFAGLYRYIAMPVIAEDGAEYVCLGCRFHKVSEWEENFWNNPDEFPNDGSAKSQERLMAYQTCLKWLEIHRAAKSEAA